jgi:ATP-binding cassette subfamily B protein
MIRLIKHLKPYTLSLLAVVIMIFGQVMADLQLPDYMARIVNLGIAQGNTGLITQTGFIMLLISLIGALCAVGAGFFAARTATGFSKDVREKIFEKVESFSLAEFDKFSTASLITRSTNDIQQMQMVLLVILRMVLLSPLMGVGAVIKAYDMAPSMTWIIALAVITMLGTMLLLFVIAMPKYKLLQKLVDRLNLVTRENLTGLRVVRAFNTETHEQEKFEKANADLTQVNLFVSRMMVIMHPMMLLVFNLTSIAIIWVGSHMVETGSLLVGDMIAFMQYSMQVIMSFLMVSIVFVMIPRASVSAQRVAEVLSVEPTIKNPAKPLSIPVEGGNTVEFRDVTFSYPGADEPVLKSISFTALPGETVAIIGSTGSGKSTLVNLIPRFYDVTGGQILVGGIDIREVKQEDLRKMIGYVPQKNVLFSDTVSGNIKYGLPEASKEHVDSATKTAQAFDFVNSLQDGFDTPIAQGGSNISGGQKQRLSIARALVRKPPIYIFDDTFSALDFKTDSDLRKALQESTNRSTVLVVAQRISATMNADKIIVLDEGKIVGTGRHDELLKNNVVYREIALSQLSEEELGFEEEFV